jgi:hypothetical protein
MIWRRHFKNKKNLFLNDRHEEKGVEKEDRRKLYDKRILPLLSGGDAVIFAEPVNPDLWDYYRGLGMANILPENIFYAKDYLKYPSLTKAVLADKNLIKDLKKRKFDYLIPYIESFNTEVLARKIGSKLLRPASLTEKLNNKSYYRRLIKKLEFPMIPGCTVNNLNEALDKFRELRKEGFQRAVIKKERSVSGFGVFVINCAEPLRKVFKKEFSREKSFVLEGFIEDIVFSPNIQYFIGPRSIDLIIISDQLLEKDRVSYAGNYFPSKANARPETLARLKDLSWKFCRYLRQHKCYGIVGIDFLVTKGGDIYSTEANVRFNGSTFPALVFEQLLNNKGGFSWRSFSLSRAPLSIAKFLRLNNRRLVSSQKKSGLFPLGVDLLPILGEGQFMEISG